jgi:hypothetical protein
MSEKNQVHSLQLEKTMYSFMPMNTTILQVAVVAAVKIHS